jgi:hypothetical protein
MNSSETVISLKLEQSVFNSDETEILATRHLRRPGLLWNSIQSLKRWSRSGDLNWHVVS